MKSKALLGEGARCEDSLQRSEGARPVSSQGSRAAEAEDPPRRGVHGQEHQGLMTEMAQHVQTSRRKPAAAAGEGMTGKESWRACINSTRGRRGQSQLSNTQGWLTGRHGRSSGKRGLGPCAKTLQHGDGGLGGA